MYAVGAHVGTRTLIVVLVDGWASPPGQVAAHFTKGAILEGSTVVLWVLRPPHLWGLAPAP